MNLLIEKYKKLGGDVNEKEKVDYLKNAMRALKWDETIKKIRKKSKALGFTYEQAFEILIEVEKFIIERDMRRKEDNELITLQKAYATLKRKLQNQTSTPSSSNPQSSSTYQTDKYAAFQANSDWHDPPKDSNACWHCELAGHHKNSCPDKSHQRFPGGVLAETEFHTFEEVRRKWKIEMLNKGFQIYTLPQFIDALIVKTKSTNQEDNAIVDSGASNSIMNSENHILNACEPDQITYISQVNGELIPVELKGDLELNVNLPPLEDVSVATKCAMNLLSVSQMCDNWNASMIFDKNGVSVTRKKIDLKLSEELLSGP